MIKIRAFTMASLVGAGFMLTGCGGDNGGVASTPTPVPTPVTYTTYANLTGNQTFQTAASRAQRTQGPTVTLTGVNPPTFSGTAFTSTPGLDNTVTIAYNAAASAYTVTHSTGALTFGPADLVTTNTNPKVVQYRVVGTNSSSGLSILTPSPANVDLSYTRIGIGFQTTGTGVGAVTDQITGVFGVPTVARDMPTTGSASYIQMVVRGVATVAPAGLGANITYGLDNSTGSFTANFASGTVQALLNLVPTLTPTGATYVLPSVNLGTISGTGSIASGTSNFNGTLAVTSAGGALNNGTFGGAFFGPQAAEFGYSFALVGIAAGSIALGSVAGAK